MDRFFKAIAESPSSFESVSRSAFTQARRKLKAEAFIELARDQLDYFEKHAPYKNSWHGKRVVAIDGSQLNLPYSEELESVFGGVKNQHTDRLLLAQCSVAFDVCNDLILDAAIAPYRTGEQDMAMDHLPYLHPQSDILIFDRGYPSYPLIHKLMKVGFEFCFRLSTSWTDAAKLAESDGNDIDWTLKPNKKLGLKRMKAMGLPAQIDGLRLVCIELSNGVKEILATNLTDRKTFPLETLKELYGMRWGVEEGFKTLKQVTQLEYFTGRTELAIRQDFHARVFMVNMASMIASQGMHDEKQNRDKKNIHPSKLNKTQVLAKLKDFISHLFFDARPMKFIKQMLKLLQQCFDIVRPNRSFVRVVTVHRRHKLSHIKGF